jgi:hypothetical protein
VSENKALRRIFGPKREEVKGRWRKLHNEELNNLYYSLNIVRVIRMNRACGKHGENDKCIQNFSCKT